MDHPTPSEVALAPVAPPYAAPTTLTPCSPGETIARLEKILARRAPIAMDSEGLQWATCIGFATGPTSVFVVDTLGLKDRPEAQAVWALLRAILEDPGITKYV